MRSTPTRTDSDYAVAYAKGRRAAQERAAVEENPYSSGSSAFHAWNEGHYDEQSARFLAIERHSALLWSRDDAN